MGLRCWITDRLLREIGAYERQHSERQHSERQHSERQHSERQHSERLHSERLHSERLHSDMYSLAPFRFHVPLHLYHHHDVSLPTFLTFFHQSDQFRTIEMFGSTIF
jgi:hypothetical protein